MYYILTPVLTVVTVRHEALSPMTYGCPACARPINTTEHVTLNVVHEHDIVWLCCLANPHCRQHNLTNSTTVCHPCISAVTARRGS